MKLGIFFSLALHVLAIEPSRYQSVVEALRKRVDLGDTGAYSNHHLQASPQKHDPFIVFSGDKATIKVRGPDASTTKLHPQTPEHFITFLWVEDQKGQVVHLTELKGSEADSSTEFNWSDATGTLTPYSICNLHGMWQGPTYNVGYERSVSRIFAQLDASTTGPNSFHPATATLVKHSPYVTSVNSGVAQMGVAGSDTDPKGVFHVQTPEHFIKYLFAKDQHGAVAGFKTLAVSDGAKLQSVAVSSKATELTPFEYCNLHGLWEGPKSTFFALVVAISSGKL